VANNKGSKPPENQPPVHTIPNKKAGWDTMQDGKILKHKDTKAEAMAASQDEAIKDKTEHKIHKLDGTITGSNSYGNDLNLPKDER
jgi:hypothetical protein